MKPNKNSSRGRQSSGKRDSKKNTKRTSDSKPFKRSSEKESNSNFQKKPSYKGDSRKKYNTNFRDKPNANFKKPSQTSDNDETRLNKFIANAGICSRREADVYIKAGNVKVNGKLVTEMGYKVKPTDEVKFDDSLISLEQKRYVLLNKPKNYITTMDDERGRKTVMDLIENASKERIYPVGRLDRNTTGLLLFTNDGELAKKLTHPKHNIQKLYHASLDKKLSIGDMHKIAEGFILDDKRVIVDEISYIMNQPKSEIGVKIHSGRNRIVRRIFEHFNYNVVKLDRVVFAGLTKKDLPRGMYRNLTEMEVNSLKML
ncbi:MAG: pseudouridine synthase [Lutibacter sp.]|jgi:23S rRNA pseudouridine2605 synthase|uniref:pseudouridine synthase n=1 Tax=Lutibacter sp. TaxID=1925666 RepID=UPI00299D5C69|nr:pseudouridine synthase [Lutibacter sp.]MDX1828955.1 pseudouridine synthase [Lutibacter sp.]